MSFTEQIRNGQRPNKLKDGADASLRNLQIKTLKLNGTQERSDATTFMLPTIDYNLWHIQYTATSKLED